MPGCAGAIFAQREVAMRAEKAEVIRIGRETQYRTNIALCAHIGNFRKDSTQTMCPGNEVGETLRT